MNKLIVLTSENGHFFPEEQRSPECLRTFPKFLSHDDSQTEPSSMLAVIHVFMNVYNYLFI
jgi:hypothetical protein